MDTLTSQHVKWVGGGENMSVANFRMLPFAADSRGRITNSAECTHDPGYVHMYSTVCLLVSNQQQFTIFQRISLLLLRIPTFFLQYISYSRVKHGFLKILFR